MSSIQYWLLNKYERYKVHIFKEFEPVQLPSYKIHGIRSAADLHILLRDEEDADDLGKHGAERVGVLVVERQHGRNV